MKFKTVLFLILMIIWNHRPGFGQNETYTGPPVFNSRGNHWVDSVFRSMSAVERIGQLFMAAAYSNRGKDHQTKIIDLIEKYNIGGLVFFQGGPVRQAKQTNLYQGRAERARGDTDRAAFHHPASG